MVPGRTFGGQKLPGEHAMLGLKCLTSGCFRKLSPMRVPPHDLGGRSCPWSQRAKPVERRQLWECACALIVRSCGGRYVPCLQSGSPRQACQHARSLPTFAELARYGGAASSPRCERTICASAQSLASEKQQPSHCATARAMKARVVDGVLQDGRALGAQCASHAVCGCCWYISAHFAMLQCRRSTGPLALPLPSISASATSTFNHVRLQQAIVRRSHNTARRPLAN